MSDPSTTGFQVPVPSLAQDSSLITRLTGEMRERWHNGDHPSTEAFLSRHPDLNDQPEVVVRLILEEFWLRRQSGEHVLVADFLNRFPRWRGQLKTLLQRAFSQHSTRMTSPSARIVWPKIGDSLGEYRILAELGRGGLGCVFLAVEPKLADRRVVLKVTPRLGHEHLSLARLQHTHIVPLYAVHEEAAVDRRILCMPYFGGAAFNQILEQLEAIPARQRRSCDLFAALDRLQADRAVPTLPHQPPRQLLERLSYAQAVCWLGACLAEALQFAHTHGLIHLDVKPGNVLLTAEGQPMLLDFHLARHPLTVADSAADWLGGTLAYMAPEQRAGIQALNRNKPIPQAIDGRADVYALGVLLYEMLGGTVPVANQGRPPRLDRTNCQVSVGLADIVEKCLRVEPGQRYASAGVLAADLRRHLDDQPLRGVPNHCLRERWTKWRRRQPQALRLLLLGTAVVVAALALGLFVQVQSSRDRRGVQTALAEGRQALRQHDYDHAANRLAQGLAEAETLGLAEDAAALRIALQTARRQQTAKHLHALVNRLRFLAGTQGVKGDLAPLQSQWRAAWDKRRLLLDGPNEEAEQGQVEQVRLDLLDLATVWADLRLESSKGRIPAAAARELLAVLDEAKGLFGPSQVVERQRAACLTALGRVGEAAAMREQAQKLTPRTAWEHCALGRSLLQAGEVGAAGREFRRALVLRPQDFWPNFYEGVCAFRLDDADTAAAAFRTCVALAPERAEAYCNRGLALAALGRSAEALADYTQALRLDPKLAAAALNRGILYLEEKKYSPARADLERAQVLGAKPGVVHYNLALACLGQQDRAGALRHLQRALQGEPEHTQAQALLTQLQAKR